MVTVLRREPQFLSNRVNRCTVSCRLRGAEVTVQGAGTAGQGG